MQCLTNAHKAGLADAALLKDLGMALAAAGRSHDAVQILRKALAATATGSAQRADAVVAAAGSSGSGGSAQTAPDHELHMALGEALRDCGEPEAARAQWQVSACAACCGCTTLLCVHLTAERDVVAARQCMPPIIADLRLCTHNACASVCAISHA